MKKNSIIIISFIIGISIISSLVIWNPPTNSLGEKIFFTDEKSRTQQYWEDYAESYPNLIIINETREIEKPVLISGDPKIEINGLKSEYSVDESIDFEVLVLGDGSGCAGIEVSIVKVSFAVPPIYSNNFVSICDGSHLKYLAIPISFSINTEYSSIPHLEPGKYEVNASYYQHRGSYGDTKREFIIK